ncbi:unnamed protein product [Staurois parvus]|uniref:Uncharacterized protein n=1 Tax=Staurois parvus TaxID=386267 RepID=A0ABN9GT62_9NEOB|nr:unnamed protein product [Staurois parvus]
MDPLPSVPPKHANTSWWSGHARPGPNCLFSSEV